MVRTLRKRYAALTGFTVAMLVVMMLYVGAQNVSNVQTITEAPSTQHALYPLEVRGVVIQNLNVSSPSWRTGICAYAVTYRAISNVRSSGIYGPDFNETQHPMSRIYSDQCYVSDWISHDALNDGMVVEVYVWLSAADYANNKPVYTITITVGSDNAPFTPMPYERPVDLQVCVQYVGITCAVYEHVTAMPDWAFRWAVLLEPIQIQQD